MNAWLIEYVGATPVPVYVPGQYEQTHGAYTCDAWAARRFETKEAAQRWMADPDGCQPYNEQWAAVEHGFDIKCECGCGKDVGFFEWGERTFCDGCMLF